MLRAHEAQGKHEAGTAEPGRNCARRLGSMAWLFTWLAAIALSSTGMLLSAGPLRPATCITLGGIWLTVPALWLLWRDREHARRKINRNTRTITGLMQGLEYATHYAMGPGNDGASACPMGGGGQCPQVIHAGGREWVTDTGPTGEIAQFLRALDGREDGDDAGTHSHPHGFPA